MTGRCWPSALAAALFAIHPLRAESVAWVTERKDVLSGLFFVLTLAAYAGYVRHRFSLVRYLTVIDCMGLGLLAKQMLVTVPFVLLLLDYWPLGRLSRREGRGERGEGRGDRRGKDKETRRPGDKEILLPGVPSSSPCLPVSLSPPLPSPLSPLPFPPRVIWEKLPMLLLAAAFSAITILVQGDEPEPHRGLSLWWRLGNGVIACVEYLARWLYPANLSLARLRLPQHLPLTSILAGLAILSAVTAVVLAGRRKRPYLLVGWLWYLGMLVPVSGLVQVGTGAAEDRFTYLPQIGLAMAVAWGAAEACRRLGTRWCCCAVATRGALAVGRLRLAPSVVLARQ